MAKPLRDTNDITDFDMYRPCIHCGSPECDPDQMELWVGHLVSCHGYKVVKDTPASRDGSRPRTITLNLVGWPENVRFKANTASSCEPACINGNWSVERVPWSAGFLRPHNSP